MVFVPGGGGGGVMKPSAVHNNERFGLVNKHFRFQFFSTVPFQGANATRSYLPNK